MRSIVMLFALVSCAPAGLAFAEEGGDGELEKARSEAVDARQAAAADPTIKDAKSPPVVAYLAEQQRRRLTTTVGLRQRIKQFVGDKSQESLIPILKQQLADLENKAPEPVSFDSAYGYQPATGLVGYSKKVRLLENTKDGKTVVLVDNANTALVLAGLASGQYASGKFLSLEKAILVGVQQPDFEFRGSKKKCYAATLVDLQSLLDAVPRQTP